MRRIIVISILALILVPSSLTWAQNEPFRPDLGPESPNFAPEATQNQPLGQDANFNVNIDINTVLEPQSFIDKLFGFFKNDPLSQEAADTFTREGAFDETNEAIGEKIGVNPLDILKAFVRAIIWALESTLAFLAELVN